MNQPLQSAEAYNYHLSDPKTPALSSSGRIAPLLVELFQPNSVVDVGCGIGIWLSALRTAGVQRTFGIDGPWVKQEYLVIPTEQFASVDFNSPGNILERIREKFGLVVCLEVAEHLPEVTAESLIDTLTQLGELVCFSAAIPRQGGYQHINEQWQSYWARKFVRRGFQPFDLIRPLIASDHEIADYYRQTIIVYAGPTWVDRCSEIATRTLSKPRDPDSLDYVVPSLYSTRTDPMNYSIRGIVRAFPHLVGKLLRACLHR